MDLIEALEKTKIQYPDLKTVGDFSSILNNVNNSSDPLFKKAKDKVTKYLNLFDSKAEDSFDKFIVWLETSVKSKSQNKKSSTNANDSVLKVFKRAYGLGRTAGKKSLKSKRTYKKSYIKPSLKEFKKPIGLNIGGQTKRKRKNRTKYKDSYNRPLTSKEKFFKDNYKKTHGLLGLTFQCPSCQRMLYQTRICSRCNP